MTAQQTVSDSGAARDNSPMSSGACPFGHGMNGQKTARLAEPLDRPIERDADGIWHVRSFALARQILRSGDTRQAGFGSDMLERMGGSMRQPILFLEGKEHHEQRKDTARFFTPKWVSDNYRPLMQRLTDSILDGFKKKRRGDLSVLAMEMAVGVAGEVVGLTDSRLPGMDKRINAFFAGASTTASKSLLLKVVNFIPNQFRLVAFYYLDVAPAIAARRKAPKEDVISHLLACGYRNPEILT
jgi:cytochrome P450